MRRNIYAATIALLTSAIAFSQDAFTVKGKVTNLKEPTKVFLSYMKSGERMSDSVIVKNGVFQFKGEVSIPVKATLSMKALNDTGPRTPEKILNADEKVFFLDAGLTTVEANGKVKEATVSGGAAQHDYLALTAALKPLADKMAPLSKQMSELYKDRERNKQAIDSLFPELRTIRIEMTKVEDAFIYSHPDSYVSFDLVQHKAILIDVKSFEPFYNALSQRLLSTVEGKELTRKFTIAKKTNVGQIAPDFTQLNTEGVPVSLSSFRGKYVLVDFWASWCGPCRMENPNVLKAYNKFKDKNFEILAVSLDDKKEPWLKAIEQDGLTWVHVSDLLGWKNAVAADYGVSAVPQNLLLDPNGVIIARNMRGDDLDKKLSELIPH